MLGVIHRSLVGYRSSLCFEDKSVSAGFVPEYGAQVEGLAEHRRMHHRTQYNENIKEAQKNEQ